MKKKTVGTVIYMLVLSTIMSLILAEMIKTDLELFRTLFFPEDPLIPYPLNLIGLILIVVGLVLVIWANYSLLRKISLKEREPFHIPSNLVIEGPFNYSRNPVYFSVILMVLGSAILVSSLVLLICSIGIFILFNNFFIRWEEKKLEKTFGQEYLDFKKRVRRWL